MLMRAQMRATMRALWRAQTVSVCKLANEDPNHKEFVILGV